MPNFLKNNNSIKNIRKICLCLGPVDLGIAVRPLCHDGIQVVNADAFRKFEAGLMPLLASQDGRPRYDRNAFLSPAASWSQELKAQAARGRELMKKILTGNEVVVFAESTLNITFPFWQKIWSDMAIQPEKILQILTVQPPSSWCVKLLGGQLRLTQGASCPDYETALSRYEAQTDYFLAFGSAGQSLLIHYLEYLLKPDLICERLRAIIPHFPGDFFQRVLDQIFHQADQEEPPDFVPLRRRAQQAFAAVDEMFQTAPDHFWLSPQACMATYCRIIEHSTSKHRNNLMTPKYLLPIFKPFFDPSTLLRDVPHTYMGTYYNVRAGRHDIQKRVELTGRNTGNLMFIESIVRELGLENCTFLEDLKDSSREFVESHFDAIVVPGSNYIQPTECSYLERKIKQILDDYDLPVVIIGIGVQMPRTAQVYPGTVDILKRISERTAIGARGALTAEILERAGISNVKVIGCPSVFYSLNPSFRIEKPAEFPSGKLVAFNTEFQAPGIHFLRRMFEKDNTVLFMQNEPLFWFETNKFAYSAAEFSWVKIKNSVPDFPLDEFRKIRECIDTRSVIFFNVTQWMEALRTHCAMSFGTRFHGNMVALQAGIPAVWLNHDIRTNELLDLLKLPSIQLNEREEVNLESIYRDADFDPFNRAYPKLYANYLQFMQQNGLRTILPQP